MALRFLGYVFQMTAQWNFLVLKYANSVLATCSMTREKYPNKPVLLIYSVKVLSSYVLAPAQP